jgi:hypothetical protein
VTLPTFNIGDQLPMFVDVGALMGATRDGRLNTYDTGGGSVDKMWATKLEECYERGYSLGELYDAQPSLVCVDDPFSSRPYIADGHHRLAAWGERGLLAPVLVTDDVDEVYASCDVTDNY